MYLKVKKTKKKNTHPKKTGLNNCCKLSQWNAVELKK